MDTKTELPGKLHTKTKEPYSRRRALLLLAVTLGVSLMFSLHLSGCTRRATPPPVAVDPAPGPETPPSEPEAPEVEHLEGLFLVSIGNNPSGRPPSGLKEAAVVFEVPAEGGITRLMAGFSMKVGKIGPVRSARKPLVQLAVGFDTPFAHCGGSDDSFEIIRTNNTKSMDDIYSAGECFWRSNDRSAPDNLYTSTDKLIQGAAKRSFGVSIPDFYQVGTLSGAPALYIAHEFSNSTKYPNLVEYRYQSSSYVRLINGQEHVNDNGESIAPAALVFLQVKTTYPTGKAIEVDMDVTGQGKALFFSNGVMCEGTWEKPSLKDPIRLNVGSNGAGLEEGMIWIHLVPDLAKVVVSESLDHR